MIKVANLSKTISKKKVLSDINLTFINNNIYALVGPNGSGKTTLINCLLGFIEIDKSGQIFSEYKKDDYSFVGDYDELKTNLTGKEFILMIAGIYGLDNIKALNLCNAYSELFQIKEDLDKLIKSYSHGMIKKTILISQLILNRKVMIFDEPTNGLDAESINIFEKIISSLNKSNKIIIISSHNLDLVERISDGLIVLNQGSIVFNDSVNNFKTQFNGKSINNSWLKLINKNEFYDEKFNKIQELLQIYY